jgi:hypothetical protein
MGSDTLLALAGQVENSAEDSDEENNPEKGGASNAC